MKALALFLALSSGLAASSVETWVGGTRPYETVPYFELNAGAFTAMGGERREGFRLDYGILDHWSVQGDWKREDAPLGGRQCRLGTQLRLGEEGQYPLDLAAFAEARHISLDDARPFADPSYAYGLILAREWAGHTLSLNASYASADGLRLDLGYRSPFLLSALQLGLEATSGVGRGLLAPQISLSLPGDVAIQAGPRWNLGGGDPAWLFSLSYEIFPTP